jgi:hypothetical protein
MAKLYPEYNQLLKENPTEAELRIIELVNKFDDSYELFYKPFLNGDIPTFVLVKKSYGMFIFEVFTDNIFDYEIDNKYLKKKSNDGEIELVSPFAKVDTLRTHFINLHFQEFFEKLLKDYHYRKIINSVVYLHNTSSDEFEKWYSSNFSTKKSWKLFDTQVVTNDTLTKERFDRMFQLSGFQTKSKYFSDELYKQLFRYLKPSYHRIDNGTFINFSDEQIKILRNPNNAKLRKIRGVAGSGKTLLLAKIAVDEYVKTQRKVLILTYNLSLRNYIYEQINRIPSDFSWDGFEIKNYHDFFKSKAMEYNLQIKYLSDFENRYFFDRVKDQITRYNTIFIDEIQDYKEHWVEIIKKFFLAEGGSYTVFGDEKQNIYDRPMNPEDDKRPYTGVPGKYWNILEETARLSDTIRELAQQFQETFLGNKYRKDLIKQTSVPIDFSNAFGTTTNTVNYQLLLRGNNSTYDLYKYIHQKVRELNVHPHDIGILGSRVEYIRDLSFLFENMDGEKTTLMSESKEEWWRLLISDTQIVPIENRIDKFFKPMIQFCPALKALASYTHNENELYEKLKEHYLNEAKGTALNDERNSNDFRKCIEEFEVTEHLIAQGKITLEHFYPDWHQLNNKILQDNLKPEIATSFRKLTQKSTVFDLNKAIKVLPSMIKKKYETQFQYLKNLAESYNYLTDQLETIRRSKKLNFRMKTDGTMKLSTIHSFKGWEIHTLFLILDGQEEDQKFLTDELVYTAITRARFNIIILNLGMMKYHQFFENSIRLGM